MPTITELSELSGEYVLDPEGTRIGFIGKHSVGPQVRGEFEEFEGSAHLDGDTPSKSGIQLTLRSQSLQTRNRFRDDPLRTKFLDAASHPVITFTSTEVEHVDGSRFRVTGDLTLRGTTKPLTLDVETTGGEHDPQGRLRVGFRGSVTINRKDWGASANAVDTLIVSSKVTVEFEVAAVRQP
ncbi:YceI family protein [Streptomyces sp. NPDC058308]|uniref:YceI family protein n=1 Tax=Streptomyces sp. NPDC058308 TaxID=3346440 RepID=UPI0036E27FAA